MNVRPVYIGLKVYLVDGGAQCLVVHLRGEIQLQVELQNLWLHFSGDLGNQRHINGYNVLVFGPWVISLITN